MTLRQAEEALSSQSLAFADVQGCVLLSDSRTPHARTVSKHLQRCGGDAAKVERIVNRRFIVAHLLDDVMEQPLSYASGTLTPEACGAIARIAEARAATLREALRQEFPTEPFTAEVVGADYAEEEPLEVCVTFHHTA